MADASKSNLVEQDPAVERGERLATGKAIARGGKTTGAIPGAAEKVSTTADPGTVPSSSPEPGMPSHPHPGDPEADQRGPGK